MLSPKAIAFWAHQGVNAVGAAGRESGEKLSIIADCFIDRYKLFFLRIHLRGSQHFAPTLFLLNSLTKRKIGIAKPVMIIMA